MPTAGRLAAAVALAILGGYTAFFLIGQFEEGSVPSFWYPLCVGAGIWSGWVVVGKRAGRGYTAAVSNGFTGTLAWIFWVVFIVAFADMIKKSMRRSYDGPVEAVVNVFEIMIDVVQELYTPEAIMVLAGGAVAVGLFSEFFAKRFT